MSFIIGFFAVSGVMFYAILFRILFAHWDKENKNLLTESDWLKARQ